MANNQELPRNRAELLESIADSWNPYVALIDSLADDEWTGKTDERGWTVKDHVAHITAWENVVVEVFQHGSPQYETLQIPESEWMATGMEGANTLLHTRKAGQSLRRVKSNRDITHARVVTMISGLSEQDIHRPFADFGAALAPGSVIVEMMRHLTSHYDAHRFRIATLLASQEG
jgi:hypothetical protein